MDPTGLARIERLNYVLSAVLAAAAFIMLGRPYALGFTVGAVIASVNFSMIRRLVQKWMLSDDGARSGTAMLFLPKMIGLIAAVFLAVRFLPISAVAMAIGFSIFLVSIFVETIRFSMNPPRPANEPSGEI